MRRMKRINTTLISILKDKISLIKATLFLTTTSHHHNHLAILHATTHHPSEPPPDYTLNNILTLGNHHTTTATNLITTLLHRLHHTHTPHVALKCLLTIHHILSRGSHYFLRDKITVNLSSSKFHNLSDHDTWHVSNWVKWYAHVLEQNLTISRSIGFFLSHLTSQTQINHEKIPTSVILNEVCSLILLVEEISKAPESLNYQKMGLIYEAMKLVGEDYRLIMREISSRIEEIHQRIDILNDDELFEILINLKKLLGFKDKLLLMFLNKKKIGVWEMIDRVKKDVENVNVWRESMKIVRFKNNGYVSGDVALSAIVPVTSGKRWLDVDWNSLRV